MLLPKLHQAAATITFYAIDQPSPVPPPGVGAKVAMVMNWLMWGGITAFTAGLIIAFIMIMLANNDRAPGFTSHLGGVSKVILGGIGLTAIGAVGTAIFA